MSHSLPRIKFKRGFAQQNFSLHAFSPGHLSSCKEATNKTKQKRTKQSKPTDQPTNQTTNQTNNQTIKQPNDQQITKPPENKTTQHPNIQPTNKTNSTNHTKPKQIKPNKTRKKQTKTNQPPNKPTNQPTQPNKPTARNKKRQSHNEDDPCRKPPNLSHGKKKFNMPDAERTKRCTCHVEFYIFLDNPDGPKSRAICHVQKL